MRPMRLLYCALFWIQGKTVETTVRGGKHCTVPYFGFKAKQLGSRSLVPTIVLCLILDSRQNVATEEIAMLTIVLCLILDSRQNCSPVALFGKNIVLCLILDSRQNKYASGLMTQGGCPSLAAQFQTDFCQSFFNGAGGMKLYVQNMAPVAEVIPSMLR